VKKNFYSTAMLCTSCIMLRQKCLLNVLCWQKMMSWRALKTLIK